MLRIYAAVNKVGNLWKLNKSLTSRSRKSSVVACEGLCGLRAKDVASEDTGETAADRVQPVRAKIGEEVLWKVSPEEKRCGKQI